MLIIYFDSHLLSFMGGQLNLRFSYLDYKIIFFIFGIIFIFTDLYLLKKIKESLPIISFHHNKNKKSIKGSTFSRIYNVIFVSQLILIGLLSYLLIDILIFNKYFVLEVLIIIICSYVTGISFLLFTTLKFIKWYRQKTNLLFLLYSIFFLLFSVNLLISSFLISSETLEHPKEKREIPISLFFAGLFGERTDLEKNVNILYSILSSIIFILIWIVNVSLLKFYSVKLGKIQYGIIIILPLIFLFSIFQYEGGALQDIFHLPYNFQNNTNYTIITSLFESIYGIIFGTYFLIIYKKIVNQVIRKYLIFMIIGVILLVSSNEIYSLKAFFYPPFGTITLSYIGISSFLVYYGFFGLAMSLSKNRELVKEIYQLLKKDPIMIDISLSQEIENIVREKINTLPSDLSYTADRDNEIEDKEINKIMELVKTEIQKFKESKDTNN